MSAWEESDAEAHELQLGDVWFEIKDAATHGNLSE